MSTGSRIALVWLALGMTLASCAPRPRTQVMVSVRAEPLVAASARMLRVTVMGGGSGALSERLFEEVGSLEAPVTFPVDIAVVPQGNDVTRRFSVQVTALDGGGASLGTVLVSASFVPGRYVPFDLLLEDCCRTVSCEPIETCRDCACREATVDLERLVDAGAPRDVGGPEDAGLDTGIDAEIDAASPPAVYEVPFLSPQGISPGRSMTSWAPPTGPFCPSDAIAPTADHAYGAWYLQNGSTSTETLRLTTERSPAGTSIDPVLVVYDVASPGDPIPADPRDCLQFADDSPGLGADAQLVVAIAPGDIVLCVLTTAVAGPLPYEVQVSHESL